jgi:hypothetical protein
MKKIIILILLLASNDVLSWSLLGPNTYDECILENMKGVNTDLGARLVNKSCRETFKEKNIDTNQSRKWILITEINDGNLYYDKSTVSRRGNIVTFEWMADSNKIQQENGIQHYSVMAKGEIDCHKLLSRELSIMFKSGHMGQGDTVLSYGLRKEEKAEKESHLYKQFCIN